MNMTENYTPEEEKAISEFRNRIENELPETVYEDKSLLYRFLKARDFNLKQSEAMLRKCLRIRKTFQADTHLKDFKASEVLTKYISISHAGFDKEGCPIMYSAVGNIDSIGIFKSSNSYNLGRYILQHFEAFKELYKQQSRKFGRNIHQTMLLYDLDKFSPAKATHRGAIQFFMKYAVICQDIHPEELKRFYIINAPSYFTLAYNAVKSILAAVIVDKMRVFGRSGWKEELQKTVDEDTFPAFLGGKRTDPDGNPLCLTFINHAGEVPESYYLVKDVEKTARKPGMKHKRLERQGSVSIPVHIEKPMSILNWEFETKCYDIGFGLTLETSNEELIPIHKIETELEPICGMHKCDKAGKYCIVFDNSYSWIHHKDIYYRTWVEDADS